MHTACVYSWFCIHRERADGQASYTVAVQILQSRKGIHHSKYIVRVPERNIVYGEASDGSECREEEREAGMQREVP